MLSTIIRSTLITLGAAVALTFIGSSCDEARPISKAKLNDQSPKCYTRCYTDYSSHINTQASNNGSVFVCALQGTKH